MQKEKNEKYTKKQQIEKIQICNFTTADGKNSTSRFLWETFVTVDFLTLNLLRWERSPTSAALLNEKHVLHVAVHLESEN